MFDMSFDATVDYDNLRVTKQVCTQECWSLSGASTVEPIKNWGLGSTVNSFLKLRILK